MSYLNLVFFAIKDLQQIRNKNQRTGINNQKQPQKGVLSIESKKMLNNTTT